MLSNLHVICCDNQVVVSSIYVIRICYWIEFKVIHVPSVECSLYNTLECGTDSISVRNKSLSGCWIHAEWSRCVFVKNRCCPVSVWGGIVILPDIGLLWGSASKSRANIVTISCGLSPESSILRVLLDQTADGILVQQVHWVYNGVLCCSIFKKELVYLICLYLIIYQIKSQP